jgi:ribosomal protein S18 acetylase RimI-like enzyme
MLTIRTATEADAPVIADIIGQSFRREAELLGISQKEYPGYVAFETEAGVRRRLDAGAYVAPASRGHQIVGTVSCASHRDRPAEIVRLAVVPLHRGNDYGRELMAHAENRLEVAGAAAVAISIVAKFRRLQSYYEELGYSVWRFKSLPSLPFAPGGSRAWSEHCVLWGCSRV